MRRKSILTKAVGILSAVALSAGTLLSTVPVFAAAASKTYSTGGATWEKQGENVYVAKNGSEVICTVTRNGNVWTYDFNVVDADAQYYVYEQMADTLTGYTSAGSDGNAATTANPGIITAGSDTAEYTITNSKEHEEPAEEYFGSLSVTKNVSGTTVSADRKFVFIITLSGSTDALAEKISGSKIFDGVPFVDGQATISLSAGETKTIGNLPEGLTYSVVESTETDFSSVVTNGTGTIVKDTTAAVTCTNTANENQPDAKTTSFYVTKKVESNGSATGKYTFHISLSGLKIKQEYTLSNGATYTSDSNGNGDVTVELSDGDSVGILDIPVGSTYQVTEDGGEYSASYKITNSGSAGNITQSSDYAGTQGTDLSTAIETAEEDENINITFTNKITKVQDLKIAKKSVDAKGNALDDSTQYSVLVYMTGLDANQKIISSSGALVADDDGIIEEYLFISPNEVITIMDVPVGTKYQITEEANALVSSYAITDSANKNSIVKSSDANTLTNTDLATSTETVDEGEDVTVTFTNTKPNTAKLKVVKYAGTKASGTTTKLGGAEFALYKEDGTAVNLDGTGNNTIVIKSSGESDVIASDNLVAGKYYLQETKAPDGYLLSDNLSFTISETDAGKTVVVNAYDDAIVTFPITGGEGRTKIVAMAMLFMGAAIAGIIVKKTKKAE